MSQYEDNYHDWYWDEEMEAEYRAERERERQAQKRDLALAALGAAVNKLKQETRK